MKNDNKQWQKKKLSNNHFDIELMWQGELCSITTKFS